MFRKIAAKSVLGGGQTLTNFGSCTRGDVVWLSPPNDAIGWRAYRLVQIIQSGGMSVRELAARVADVSLTGDDSGGNGTYGTTEFVDDGAFTQSPTLVGDLFVHTDDAGAAGGLPEGEFAVIKFQDESGDDFITFESDFPLSAAGADSDTAVVRRMWRGDDAADADFRFNILGVCPAAFSANDYGYVQAFGVVDVVLVNTVAPTINTGLKAAAVGVTGDGTDGFEENIGIALATVSAGGDGARIPMHIDVIFGMVGGSADND